MEEKTAGAVAEQVMGATNDARSNEPQYRTTEWPSDPPPVFGEPVGEYLTREDIVARVAAGPHHRVPG